MDALAIAIRPGFQVDAIAVPDEGVADRCPWTLRLWVTSAFPASDVRLEAKFVDGVRKRDHWERIAPGDVTTVVMREIDTPPGGPKPEEFGEMVTLTYSDERGIRRYRQRYGFVVTPLPDGGKRYGTSLGFIDEERIR